MQSLLWGWDEKNQVDLFSDSDGRQNSHLCSQTSLSFVGRKWKIQVAGKAQTRFRARLTAGIFFYPDNVHGQTKNDTEGPKETKKKKNIEDVAAQQYNIE